MCNIMHVFLFICFLICANVSYGEETYYTAVEERDLVFILSPGETAVINFEPNDIGFWTVHTWHDGLGALWQTSVIDYYWTDLADPEGEYHYWQSDPFHLSWWLRSTEVLWSGSESIGYQFHVRHISQTVYPSTVIIYIQRWN